MSIYQQREEIYRLLAFVNDVPTLVQIQKLLLPKVPKEISAVVAPPLIEPKKLDINEAEVGLQPLKSIDQLAAEQADRMADYETWRRHMDAIDWMGYTTEELLGMLD